MTGSTTPLDSSLSRTQCEDAVRRVLSSQTFARAEKLQRFLKYVAETTLRGDAALLHEHLIAVDVFERGQEFARGEDSVVRRQAHALRRKLRDYYETEGQADPVQIDLPLGTYVPAFHQRAEPTPSPVAADAPAVAAPAVVQPEVPATHAVAARPPWMYGAAVALAVLTAFLAGWVLSARRAASETEAWEPDAAVREIWGPWLSHADGAVFGFSNPPGASIRQFGGPIQPNPEHQGLSVTPAQDSRIREFFRFSPGGHVYLYPIAAQAKMGEALAAVSLTGFLTHAGQQVRALQSRFITWETMRQENVILMGHADSNQWITPVLQSAPFTLASTDEQHRARILNNKPAPGEQPAYLPTVPDTNKSYALISMLPGVDRAHQLLVIGGLDTSSTTAAAEYLISPVNAAELLRRLKASAPNHRGPWHFQVVLQTDVRDTVPVNAFPVALRVL